MKDTWKYLIAFVVGLVIGLCFCFFQRPEVETQTKYIPVHDTVVVDSERIVNHTIVKYVDRVDTFYVTQDADTVYVRDMPIEHKIYNDTLSTDSTSAIIDLRYHGFNAGIDSLNIIYNYYNKETTVYKLPKKYGLDIVVGPSAGYGYGINGWSPWVGGSVTIGFGYRITK